MLVQDDKHRTAQMQSLCCELYLPGCEIVRRLSRVQITPGTKVLFVHPCFGVCAMSPVSLRVGPLRRVWPWRSGLDCNLTHQLGKSQRSGDGGAPGHQLELRNLLTAWSPVRGRGHVALQTEREQKISNMAPAICLQTAAKIGSGLSFKSRRSQWKSFVPRSCTVRLRSGRTPRTRRR